MCDDFYHCEKISLMYHFLNFQYILLLGKCHLLFPAGRFFPHYAAIQRNVLAGTPRQITQYASLQKRGTRFLPMEHTLPADGARSSVRWSTLFRPMEHAPLAWVIYTPVFGVLSGIGETTYCARTRKCMRVYK